MKKLFGKIKELTTQTFDPVLDNPLARAASPDDLIAAKVLKSLAKDFEDWYVHTDRPGSYNKETFNGFAPLNKVEKSQTRNYNPETKYLTFVNTKLNISISVQYYIYAIYGWNSRYWKREFGNKAFVRDLPVESKLIKSIIPSYVELKEAVHNAKAVSEQAKQEMQQSKDKWELAERLLGMKRNEQGALVPIVETVREEETKNG